MCSALKDDTGVVIVIVFFFKQKTAYEIQYGLVGSEMCIRDSGHSFRIDVRMPHRMREAGMAAAQQFTGITEKFPVCLLYTSDAADERSSVDLGGRRIIKKKTNVYTVVSRSIVKINKYVTTQRHNRGIIDTE